MENPKKRIIDINFPRNNTVIVSGAGRSGTSWLSEIINYKNTYRYMFEPLQHTYVPEASEFIYPYLEKHQKAPKKLKKLMNNIISGKLRNDWVDGQNNKYFTNKRLVKFIRIHFMHAWLKENYPQIKSIYIIRNPYSVSLSMIKNKWEISADFILDKENLYNKYFTKFKKLITEIKQKENVIYIATLRWVLLNYVIFRQYENSDKSLFKLVSYENLVENPKDTTPSIFQYLNLDFDDQVYDKMKKPSALVSKKRLEKGFKNITSSWQNQISEDDLEYCEKIIAEFGLNKFYKNGEYIYEN
jgi:hypothetical protein